MKRHILAAKGKTMCRFTRIVKRHIVFPSCVPQPIKFSQDVIPRTHQPYFLRPIALRLVDL